MKKVKIVIILFIVAFILSGCFEVNTVIKLNKNGSGTLEETVLISQMMMQQMGQMAQGFGGESDNETDSSMYNVEELKAAALEKGEGVSYVSSEAIVENGKSGYKVIYKFNNINTLKLSDDPSSKIDMPNMGEEEAEKEFMTFRFKKGLNSELTIVFPEDEDELDGEEYEDYSAEMDEEEKDMGEMNDGMAEMMKQMYSGMKFSTTIIFNGKITKTDATYVDGNVVTLLEMDFDKIMEDPDAFKNLTGMDGGSPAEAKEAMKNLPGIKVEVNDKITVKFK